MITPPFLTSGDKIGIPAPAGKIEAGDLNYAVKILEGWGLEVVLGKNIFNSFHQFAATDRERIADLQEMLDDPSIKAILNARGGYGTLRVIDHLDFSSFARHPKWMVGYSDITVLHSHIHSNYQVETLHATMPINYEKNKEATEALGAFLFGEELSYDLENNQTLHAPNRVGNAIGILTGGNLSLLHSLIGSQSDLKTHGKILFIEDLGEYLYHIDRMMLSLKRAGKLDRLTGLIVGGMTEMKDNSLSFGRTAEEIIMEHVSTYHYPVCFGFPAGHIDRNLPLVFGRELELRVTKTTTELQF